MINKSFTKLCIIFSFVIFSNLLLSCSSKLVEVPDLTKENIKQYKNKNPIEFSKLFSPSVKKYKNTFYIGELHVFFTSSRDERVRSRLNKLLLYFKEYCRLNDGYNIENLFSLFGVYEMSKIINKKKIKSSLIKDFENYFSTRDIPSYYKDLAYKAIDKSISKEFDFLASKILNNLIMNNYKIEVNPDFERKLKRSIPVVEPVNYKLLCLNHEKSFLLGSMYVKLCLSAGCHESYFLFLRKLEGAKVLQELENNLITEISAKVKKYIEKTISEDKKSLVFIINYPAKYKNIFKSINIYKLSHENELELSIEFSNETKHPYILDLSNIGTFTTNNGKTYAVIYTLDKFGEIRDVYVHGATRLKGNKILINPNERGYVNVKFSIPGLNILKGILYIDNIPVKIITMSRYQIYKQNDISK